MKQEHSTKDNPDDLQNSMGGGFLAQKEKLFLNIQLLVFFVKLLTGKQPDNRQARAEVMNIQLCIFNRRV